MSPQHTLEIKSGKIVVSDPCYTIDTHCLYVTDINNGSYYITPHKPFDSMELTILRSDVKFKDVSKTEKLLFDDIGVDTGMFGFFDYDWFVDVNMRLENMHNNECQFVAHTFVGDGTFMVFGYYLNGDLVGLKLK